MDGDTVFPIAQLVITIVVLVVSAVWVVSKISTETALLRASIDHLSESVRELKVGVEHQDQRTDDHEGRLIRLETQSSGPRDRAARSK